MKGAGEMRKQNVVTIYDRFIADQIEKSAAEDHIFLFAKRLVTAKDEEGLNLFWDEDEERVLRDFIEYAEDTSEC
jgi:predicted dithiol-disulfide oxidoreductase (DUF899 family)